MKILRKTLKIIIFLVIINILLLCIGHTYAAVAESSGGSGGSSEHATLEINPDTYKPDNISDATEFTNAVNILIGTLRVIGTIISVVTIIIIGIKFIMGSASERAEYKETLIPYLIGAVLVFAIPNILGVVYDLVTSVKMP